MKFKKSLKVLKRIGDDFFAQRVEESLKNIVINGAFFDELGFYYIGPVDGHDFKAIKRYTGKSQRKSKALRSSACSDAKRQRVSLKQRPILKNIMVFT
ncbi:MAG: hypothetical protein MZV65_45120 [Chromatiales bacterium]|nr:hypothetical protein [Chromatiales bacterium]